MKTVEEILEQIEYRSEQELAEMKEIRKIAGTQCPGFNQCLGRYDELEEMREFILDEN